MAEITQDFPLKQYTKAGYADPRCRRVWRLWYSQRVRHAFQMTAGGDWSAYNTHSLFFLNYIRNHSHLMLLFSGYRSILFGHLCEDLFYDRAGFHSLTNPVK